VPPVTIVAVQSLLYASLETSLIQLPYKKCTTDGIQMEERTHMFPQQLYHFASHQTAFVPMIPEVENFGDP